LYTIYAIAGGSIIIWQHRDNLKRLLNGTERRVGMPGLRN
jgi:glycerol-3-phosphate acyltransferase PlsY